MQYPIFEKGLHELAVIRCTLETMPLFASDDSIREEIFDLISTARTDFLHRMEGVHARMLASPQTLTLDYELFRASALKMMTEGFPGRNLNRLMKVSVFEEGKSALYYFEAAGMVDLLTARTMPAYLFVALLFNEVWQSAANPANYADLQTFDACVYRNYIVLMFLNYSVTDPMFYGIISH